MALKQINEVIAVYRHLASLPTMVSASLSKNIKMNGSKVIRTQWSQRDLPRKEKIKSAKLYFISQDKLSVIGSLSPQENANEIWHEESPSGKLVAIVRQIENTKGEKQQIIEVWDNKKIVKRVDVKFCDKHGKIYEDDAHFGSFQWSKNEDKLLYMAEKKPPKLAGFFDEVKPEDDESKKTDDTVKGEEHIYRPHWGEQFAEKQFPVICVLDINVGTIDILEGVPDDVSPRQAVWTPEGNVLFIGTQTTPWRLGLIYCAQRRSHVYYLDITTGECKPLTESGRSVRCPRFSLDGTRLVYQDCPDSGPHDQCMRLMMMNWTSKQSEVIFDIQHSESTASVGIYEALAPHCWCIDSRRIVFSTLVHSQRRVFLLNTETKRIYNIHPDFHKGSCTVLDVQDDLAIVQCSSPNQTGGLIVGRVPEASSEDQMQWQYLDDGAGNIDGIIWQVLTHIPTGARVHPKFGSLQYESILLLPALQEDEKPPLIVLPHGGPHSVFDSQFLLFSAGFCLCGFAVLLVNYRGSLGFGQNNVDSLLGNIGDQDVKDVQTAAEEVIDKGLVDGKRVVIFGGSHGGFLTTHLIGQYPAFYRAAACRNPVVNLTTMFGTTDIPDWVFVETGLEFNHNSQLSQAALENLWKCSPIRYVDQVTTPLLLMLGKDDLRVPPTQAREFYRALLGRNVPVRLHEYANNSHPISSVEAESDCFVNIVSWFNQHL